MDVINPFVVTGAILHSRYNKFIPRVSAALFWCLSIENAARNHYKIFPEPPVYVARSTVQAKLDGEARITVAANS